MIEPPVESLSLSSLLFAGSLVLTALLASASPAAAGTLVVANKAEATVSLVDVASGEVVATLPTGAGPHEVAVSPDGGRRWWPTTASASRGTR